MTISGPSELVGGNGLAHTGRNQPTADEQDQGDRGHIGPPDRKQPKGDHEWVWSAAGR